MIEPVEYWRLWSDSADEYACHDDVVSGESYRLEFYSLKQAEYSASAMNNPRWTPHDWRPVKVRETVVEE